LESALEKTQALTPAEEYKLKRQEFWSNWFKQNDKVYFLTKEDRFIQQSDEDGVWNHLKTSAAKIAFNIESSTADWDVFKDNLNEGNRVKIKSVFSFNKTKNNELNILSQDGWCKPTPGKHNVVFDILMRSLSNNNKEAQDHIEQLIYWKYTHPEDYTLPCLILYGEGGAGKNEFVDRVLNTLFDKQTIAVKYDDIFGNYNGLVLGKTVVYIDESVANKTDSNRLKKQIGNPTVSINEKFGGQVDVENTAWYITSGNDLTGPLLLDGTSSDRRWSIIKLDNDIITHTMAVLDLERDDAIEWYSVAKKMYTNKMEVSKWFGYIAEKWKTVDKCPDGLHTSDYTELLELQEGFVDEFMRKVTTHENFTYISNADAFGLFKEFMKDEHPSQANQLTKGKKMFLHQATHSKVLQKCYAEPKKCIKIVKQGKTTLCGGFVKSVVVGDLQHNGKKYLNQMDVLCWDMFKEESNSIKNSVANFLDI